METWGAELYGDPCRECGFSWAASTADAMQMIRELPTTYRDLTKYSSGSELHPELAWNVAAYVCHVTDNLRIWAERLAGARLSRAVEVGAYDQDLLAQARGYNEVALSGALWSLVDAADAWIDSVTLAIPRKLNLLHSSRGLLTIEDIARSNAHDAMHHAWDIGRILESLPH